MLSRADGHPNDEPGGPGFRAAGRTSRALEAAEPASGGEQRLRDQILGFLQRAEHALAVRLQLAPVWVDQHGECALAVRLCLFDRHRTLGHQVRGDGAVRFPPGRCLVVQMQSTVA